jgi:hypothetical protein
MEQTKKDIPNGSYFVKATQVLPNGYYRLYVEVGDNVIEYPTRFKEFNQNYVYLKDNQVSLTPIKERAVEVVEEKPKTSRKKKRTEE